MALRGDVRPTVEREGVRFVFRVTNGGERTEELTFPDAGRADFVVEPASGSRKAERWRWSENRAFAQVIGTERLDPGESSTYEGRWPTPEPGTYLARALLRAHDRDVEATCEFTVGERDADGW